MRAGEPTSLVQVGEGIPSPIPLLTLPTPTAPCTTASGRGDPLPPWLGSPAHAWPTFASLGASMLLILRISLALSLLGAVMRAGAAVTFTDVRGATQARRWASPHSTGRWSSSQAAARDR